MSADKQKKNLISSLELNYKKPEPYDSSSGPFWDDEHISKNLLKAHLDPNTEAASRHPEFIEASTTWIRHLVKDKKHPKLLDLGCGPGLYAESFASKGFDVTGIDFSKRSITYAKEQTLNNQSMIDYHYQDYLTIDYQEAFDVVTLIYCDYAVLPLIHRLALLEKIRKSLVPGGIFIFDVFTEQQYPNDVESSTWDYHPKDGFWKSVPHLVFMRHLIYDHNIRCDEYFVIDEKDNFDTYRIWDQTFDPSSIRAEIERVGFADIKIYADIKGTPYDPSSKTMGIVLIK